VPKNCSFIITIFLSLLICHVITLSFLDLLFLISLDASSWGSLQYRAPPLLFVEFFKFCFLLLCLGHSCPRSWLFDTNLVHELVLIVFLVIKHFNFLGYG
jgi:hypothetical protein